MKIIMTKFGTVLTSRQAGKEAYNAFLPTLNAIKSNETVEMDFEGIITFSPSWGDEFITPIFKNFGDRLIFINTTNSSVLLTLQLLEKIHEIKFNVK
ncbi:MAG: STAS-like domain-containing protein [Patescibacteria group bacterium]